MQLETIIILSIIAVFGVSIFIVIGWLLKRVKDEIIAQHLEDSKDSIIVAENIKEKKPDIKQMRKYNDYILDAGESK